MENNCDIIIIIISSSSRSNSIHCIFVQAGYYCICPTDGVFAKKNIHVA